MNVIKCKNGHFFDGDSYTACPHCGEAAMIVSDTVTARNDKKGFWGFGRKDKGINIPQSNRGYSIPRESFEFGNAPTDILESKVPTVEPTPAPQKELTLDFWQTSAHSEIVADADVENEPEVELAHNVIEDEEAVTIRDASTPSDSAAQIDELIRKPIKIASHSSPLAEAVKKSSASNEEKTMSYFSVATGNAGASAHRVAIADPVVGWLVCVAGCHFGECFSIFAGKNSIGRGDENRIVIAGDSSVSRVKHAFITYEPKKKNFYFQPGDSSGLTYLNDEYITDINMLSSYDKIELGDSKFVFVPLCGERFSWEEYVPKGE